MSDSAKSKSYSIERLESAGLVSLVTYADDPDGYVRVLLWPDEAEALALELDAAAKDIRNV